MEYNIEEKMEKPLEEYFITDCGLMIRAAFPLGWQDMSVSLEHGKKGSLWIGMKVY